MKGLLTKMIALCLMSMAFTGCYVSVSYTPSYHYNCYWTYDYWGYYYEYCVWEYYSANGEVEVSRDIVADVADKEAFALEKAAEFYATKFNLSDDQGLKLAKTINDFSALESRTSADLADFAERLYGVNPRQIATAVAKAQVGDNSALESTISQAAANFNTTADNMKEIVKYVHGKSLSENGINL